MKLNANVFHDNLPPKMAHAQVIYLYEVMNKTYEQIATITHYAVSTVKTYVRKFANLLGLAKLSFIDGEPHTTGLLWNVFNVPGTPCAYVVQFKDKYNNIVMTKIGSAGKGADQRIPSMWRKYRKDYPQIDTCIVQQLYFTKCDDDALTVENELRKSYKARYPKSFEPRDRFHTGELLNSFTKSFYQVCDLLQVTPATQKN